MQILNVKITIHLQLRFVKESNEVKEYRHEGQSP